MTTSPDKSIQAAQEFIGSGVEFTRLDQIYDLQRLIGPVLAFKILLDISVNAQEAKERRLAATAILQQTKEEPEKVAERLRASVFHDLSLEDLQAIVQSGITDPELARERLRAVRTQEEG